MIALIFHPRYTSSIHSTASNTFTPTTSCVGLSEIVTWASKFPTSHFAPNTLRKWMLLLLKGWRHVVCGDRMFNFVLDHARQQMAWVIIKFIFDSISLFANITTIFVKWFSIMFIFLFILKSVWCWQSDSIFLHFHGYSPILFCFVFSCKDLGDHSYKEITF